MTDKTSLVRNMPNNFLRIRSTRGDDHIREGTEEIEFTAERAGACFFRMENLRWAKIESE